MLAYYTLLDYEMCEVAFTVPVSIQLYAFLYYTKLSTSINILPLCFHYLEHSWLFADQQLGFACPVLSNPNNGRMTCSVENDGVSFNGDTCSFTCNTGYELTGSDTRTCQSDGSWSGSKTFCTLSEWYVIV